MTVKKPRVPKLKRQPLAHYVDAIRSGNPFSFARYGDGEWHTILGHIGMRNSNGCTFTQELCDALRHVLHKAHPYEHSILRVARRKLGPEIQNYIIDNEVRIQWTLGDVILDASLKGGIFPLIKELRQRRILYVGPKHCRRLDDIGFFRYIDFIQPPPRNSIQVRHQLIPRIIKSVRQNKIEVIGYSAGLASKVFIDDVYGILHGDIIQIDFGSMFDGYLNIPSRSYIRRGRVNFTNLLQQNTGIKLRKERK